MGACKSGIFIELERPVVTYSYDRDEVLEARNFVMLPK